MLPWREAEGIQSPFVYYSFPTETHSLSAVAISLATIQTCSLFTSHPYTQTQHFSVCVSPLSTELRMYSLTALFSDNLIAWTEFFFYQTSHINNFLFIFDAKIASHAGCTRALCVVWPGTGSRPLGDPDQDKQLEAGWIDGWI